MVALQNGDFETGSIDPWNPDNLYNVTVVPSTYHGRYAAQLTADSGQSSPIIAAIQQFVPLCRATNYSITFDYKLTSGDDSCHMSVSGLYYFNGFLRRNVTTDQLTAREWSTATLYYPNYISNSFNLFAQLSCDNSNQTATGLFDNFVIAPFSVIEPDNCPERPLTLPNGDFESGQFAPWRFYPKVPAYSIVSPGYESDYAFSTDVLNNKTKWAFRQQVPGDLCLGYNYTFTFAVNWGNSSYHGHKKRHGCGLEMRPSYCGRALGDTDLTYFAPNIPSGWQNISFTCTAAESKSLFYTIAFDCGYGQGTEQFAPFTLQLDQLKVELTPGQGQ